MSQQEVMDYRVELDAFSGPLDLLLYLVRHQEVDILNLPIAEITARFLEFLEVLQVLDLDLIGDFVVMASSLVEIKSRMALPGPEEPPELVEPDEDPRADLVRQLLEYKRFKDATRLLEEQAAEWQQRYPRLSDDRPRGGNDPSRDLIKEVELWDLVSALSRVLRKNTESGPSTVVYDDTPIGVYAERIRLRVLAEQRVAFSSFFMGTNSRSRIIGIFLALLELLRHHRFRAEQPQDYHEIWILPPLESAPASADGAPNAANPGQSPAEQELAIVEPVDEAAPPATVTDFDEVEWPADPRLVDGDDAGTAS
jgi:segregation and condensation protein A